MRPVARRVRFAASGLTSCTRFRRLCGADWKLARSRDICDRRLRSRQARSNDRQRCWAVPHCRKPIGFRAADGRAGRWAARIASVRFRCPTEPCSSANDRRGPGPNVGLKTTTPRLKTMPDPQPSGDRSRFGSLPVGELARDLVSPSSVPWRVGRRLHLLVAAVIIPLFASDERTVQPILAAVALWLAARGLLSDARQSRSLSCFAPALLGRESRHRGPRRPSERDPTPSRSPSDGRGAGSYLISIPGHSELTHGPVPDACPAVRRVRHPAQVRRHPRGRGPRGQAAVHRLVRHRRRGDAVRRLRHRPQVCACACSSKPGASLLGGGQSSVEWATFVNGLLSATSTSTTPTCRRSRPTRATTSRRCWRSARRSGPAGKDLITAAVLAYEIQCRLCDAASLRKHGVDHVTYGAISSAVAAAKLMNLDATKTDPRGRPRRRVQRRPAADAVGRAEHVEGLRVRQRRPQRRLRRDARRRGA